MIKMRKIIFPKRKSMVCIDVFGLQKDHIMRGTLTVITTSLFRNSIFARDILNIKLVKQVVGIGIFFQQEQHILNIQINSS